MNLKNLLLTFIIITAINNTSNLQAAVEPINNLKSFNEKVLKEEAVIVKFYYPGCGPCKRMKPIVEAIEKEYANKLKVFEVDATKASDVAEQFEVSSVPQLFFISNGVIRGKIVGATSAATIKSKIKAYLNI